MQITKLNLVFLLLLALELCAGQATAAVRRLRKKPKVYNALITTDENLTSSRAYPVIQPSIHEPGFAPFSPFNPFGFYSPPLVRFGQPLVPGLPPNERLPYPLPPNMPFPTNYAPYDPNELNIVPMEREREPEQVPQPVQQPPPAAAEVEPKEMPKEQLPLPLNEQGLPPVLIPLPSQYNGNPVHLPPYSYQYPVVYDQAGYTRQRDAYLPPYGYYPSHSYATRTQQNVATAQPKQQQQQREETQREMQPLQQLPLENLAAAPSFEDIKNGSESKNSAVPDVPPPPIPSGPKRSRPTDN